MGPTQLLIGGILILVLVASGRARAITDAILKGGPSGNSNNVNPSNNAALGTGGQFPDYVSLGNGSPQADMAWLANYYRNPPALRLGRLGQPLSEYDERDAPNYVADSAYVDGVAENSSNSPRSAYDVADNPYIFRLV